MAANDAELLAESFTVDNRTGKTVLSVKTIEWPGGNPCCAELVLVVVKRFDVFATADEIEQTKAALLEDEEYFRICRRCHYRKPAGLMSGTICHGCNERYLGAVY